MKIKWVPILLLALVAACIALTLHLDPKMKTTAIRAFGERPFGLPVHLVCGIGAAILFIPALWVFPALTQIAAQARKDGKGGSTNLMIYLMTVGSQHPELRRSQVVALGGAAYFVVIGAVWITYTSLRGI